MVQDGVTAFLAEEGDYTFGAWNGATIVQSEFDSQDGLGCIYLCKKSVTAPVTLLQLCPLSMVLLNSSQAIQELCLLRCTNVMLLAIVLKNLWMEALGMQLHRLIVARSLAQVKYHLGLLYWWHWH